MSVTLIILSVITILVMSAMENTLLNQKMGANEQAELVAFNGAEAGLRAAELQIEGQSTDITALPGSINFQITSDTVDSCLNHVFIIHSSAIYQAARTDLVSAYVQVHQPPLPECAGLQQFSHRLWWQQV